jgi:Carboxypeptidase regulatory-like domain
VVRVPADIGRQSCVRLASGAAVRESPTVREPCEGLPRFCAEMLSLPKPRMGGLFLPAMKPILRMRIQSILVVGRGAGMLRDGFCSHLRLRGQSAALDARGTFINRIDSCSKAYRGWLLGIAVLLLSCGEIANAQSSAPAQSGRALDGIFIQNPSSPDTNNSSQRVEEDASKAAEKPGSIIGTILDQSGSVAVDAVVRLTSEDKSLSREVVSGDNGQFVFSNVPPGPFKLSVNASGFGDREFSGELAPGQMYLVPSIVLSIPTVVTDVKVAVDPVEVATEEVKEEEHQRVLGFIPNFYVTYHDDAAPLTKKLKFHLAWKSSTDPITLLGAGFLAGLQQAGGQYSEFGGGAQGYGKRFGALYADVFVSTFLSGAVFPSLLKQDPRYFYKGTGSTNSRIWRAVTNSVRCKGDNGRWQVNYSNIAGAFAGAAITSAYYPTNNQGGVILSNGFVRLGESSLAGIVQEFVVRRLTKQSKRKPQEPPDSTDVASTRNTQNNSAPWPKKPN